MFDADPGFLTHRRETNLDLRVKIEREVRLTPGENQPMRRLPDADLADLEDLAAVPRLDQPAAFARLERKPPGPGRGLEQRARPPPGADLLHEGGERPLGARGHAERHIDPGGHRS